MLTVNISDIRRYEACSLLRIGQQIVNNYRATDQFPAHIRTELFYVTDDAFWGWVKRNPDLIQIDWTK